MSGRARRLASSRFVWALVAILVVLTLIQAVGMLGAGDSGIDSSPITTGS